MRRALEFPVWDDGLREITFEPVAVPVRHDLVASVVGWVFHGEELLLVRHKERGWEIPGGGRRAGETFHQTLARVAWTDAGVLLGNSRLLGAVKILKPAASDAPMRGVGSPIDRVCLLTESRELLPFSDEFEAQDRMLIEPALVSSVVPHWSRLLDEMLAYALAVRAPSLTRAMA